MSEKGNLLRKLSKQNRFGFFRPTTAALRRALHHGKMNRTHRGWVYAWTLLRRHQSMRRSRG